MDTRVFIQRRHIDGEDVPTYCKKRIKELKRGAMLVDPGDPKGMLAWR